MLSGQWLKVLVSKSERHFCYCIMAEKVMGLSSEHPVLWTREFFYLGKLINVLSPSVFVR